MKKKVYGATGSQKCAACGNPATTKNSEEIPSCRHHIKLTHNMKCVCGTPLDTRESKYGTFFTCTNCGVISYAKALSINNLPLPRIEDL